MKYLESVTYHARFSHQFYSMLCTHSETVEGIREEIDRSNRDSVAKGYKASTFQISKETTTVVLTDENEFVSKAIIETVVETYPAG